jgi:hypothetical protein
MAKAAIPFALLVAALLVSSAPAFAKGGGKGADVASLPATPVVAPDFALASLRAETGNGA